LKSKKKIRGEVAESALGFWEKRGGTKKERKKPRVGLESEKTSARGGVGGKKGPKGGCKKGGLKKEILKRGALKKNGDGKERECQFPCKGEKRTT